METEVDIAVIGAGVIGCAIARQLSLDYPHTKIAVLEKREEVGMETSRFNSGVLHSGFHENPKFLKSRFASRGSKLAVEYLTQRSLPLLHCGMLIAVPRGMGWRVPLREFQNLWRLTRKGKDRQVPFQLFTLFQARKLEPNIRVLGGVFIPDVCVTDPQSFVRALAQDARVSGVDFFPENPVLRVITSAKSHILFTPYKMVRAKIVINAAGLYADEVALLAGFSNYKIYPWRGEYYEVVGEKKNLVRRLVYPAVSANSSVKGIHFSPRTDGRLFLGPNARSVPRKDYYKEDRTPVEVFAKVAQRFCPYIQPEDLRWGYSGIRPKLLDTDKEADFIVRMDRSSPPWINLIGIDSPGFSSSMAIAEHVSLILREEV